MHIIKESWKAVVIKHHRASDSELEIHHANVYLNEVKHRFHLSKLQLVQVVKFLYWIQWEVLPLKQNRTFSWNLYTTDVQSVPLNSHFFPVSGKCTSNKYFICCHNPQRWPSLILLKYGVNLDRILDKILYALNSDIHWQCKEFIPLCTENSSVSKRINTSVDFRTYYLLLGQILPESDQFLVIYTFL